MMQLQLHNLRVHRRWYRFCAATLSIGYLALYVLATFCLSTDVFHPEANVADSHSAQGHHDAGHSHHGHHHGPASHQPEAGHSAPSSDICDFAIQALTAPVDRFESQTIPVLSSIENVRIAHEPVLFASHDVGYSSRAPPHDASPFKS